MWFQNRIPVIANYTDVDHILDNIYLGNINAASNLSLLKRLVPIYFVDV